MPKSKPTASLVGTTGSNGESAGWSLYVDGTPTNFYAQLDLDMAASEAGVSGGKWSAEDSGDYMWVYDR